MDEPVEQQHQREVAVDVCDREQRVRLVSELFGFWAGGVVLAPWFILNKATIHDQPNKTRKAHAGKAKPTQTARDQSHAADRRAITDQQRDARARDVLVPRHRFLASDDRATGIWFVTLRRRAGKPHVAFFQSDTSVPDLVP